MPRDVELAFRKGTRSPDGRPGPNYWQNRARYNIEVTALPPDRTVRGTESIVYVNNSPDTLANPSIKLFINIHKPGAPRAYGAQDDYLTSGVHFDAVTVDGQPVQWQVTENTFTTRRYALPQPLFPHDTVRLTFKWHYEISLSSNREGMIDSTTWYLAYFYPRVAVYDDYNGWDRMDFTDLQEFYSDFNDYDVSVTVPRTTWCGGRARSSTQRRFCGRRISTDIIGHSPRIRRSTSPVSPSCGRGPLPRRGRTTRGGSTPRTSPI